MKITIIKMPDQNKNIGINKPNSILTVDSSRKKKNAYCNNCKSRGHSGKICNKPILSYGIILFKIKPKIHDNENNIHTLIKNRIFGINNVLLPNTEYDIEYLLVSRKHSISFIEFVRGNYKISKNEKDIEKLQNMFNSMSLEEKTSILLSQSFDILWKQLWQIGINDQILFEKKRYKTDYKRSIIKYKVLKDHGFNKYISLNNNTGLEWGFPKGKKNIHESHLSCAKREFEEETGISKKEFIILKNIQSAKEKLVGSDGKLYNYIYYFALLNKYDLSVSINDNNEEQKNEIGNIKWASYEEAVQLIQTNNKEDRIRILGLINKYIKSRLLPNINDGNI